MAQTEVCYICKKPGDLRPYGERSAMICFDCMKATPEREAEAGRQFIMQLNACGEVAVVGTSAGPIPISRSSLSAVLGTIPLDKSSLS